jgi:hypothetical protein
VSAGAKRSKENWNKSVVASSFEVNRAGRVARVAYRVVFEHVRHVVRGDERVVHRDDLDVVAE